MADAKNTGPGNDTRKGEPSGAPQGASRWEQDQTDAPMKRGGSLQDRGPCEDPDEKVDEALEETFPASDPPAYN